MAARKERTVDLESRKKIQTTQLINRLQNNALAAEPIMDQSQVRSAQILLDKSLPNLSSMQVSGDEANPVKHVVEIRHTIVRPKDRDS